MTRLDCEVKNCYYNEDHRCGKGDITVQGRMAVEPRETCCGSFKEKKEGCGCGCNSVSGQKEQIKVGCEATNCVYNEDCHCGANHIGICGGNACSCTDTECRSFDCK